MSKAIDSQDLEWDDNPGERFNLRQFLNKVLANWIFILISALLGLFIAYVYLYTTKPIYKTTAKILIKDDEQSRSISNIDILQSVGMASGASKVYNELEVLNSFTIMKQAIINTGLYSTFTNKKNTLKTEEYYGTNGPFIIQKSIVDANLYYTQCTGAYSFVVEKGIITLTKTSTNKQYKGRLGQAIHLPGLDIICTRNPTVKENESHDYRINFLNLDGTADQYLAGLNADVPNKLVNVISLEMYDALPLRSKNLINEVLNIYIKNGIADRNAISDSTISFINDRLVGVTSDLKNLENEIQDFKQKNEIVNISAQAEAMLKNAGDFTQSAVEQEVQLSVVNSLINFLNQTSKNPRLVPASLTVNNAALSPIISEYNKILLERQRSLLSMTEENPVVINIDEQLAGLRSNIITGLQNMRNTTQSGLSAINRNSGSLDANLRTIPAKERAFLDYSRQQSVKQELYLFLLQKREEAELSKSSTISNARIIDSARSIADPVKPNRKPTLAIGLLLGLLFPFLFMWVKGLLSHKIETKSDIEKRTSIPIVGELGHFENKNKSELIVNQQNGRHPVVEQFRALRSNLNYTLPQEGKVILITSTTPGEGKTFVSLNLASTFAMSGKKTIILGMDLRKPKLSDVLEMRNKKGLTQYLVDKATLDEIIYPIKGIENLFTIVVGVIPPNPAELLMLPKTKDLISKLSQDFDYVIIDTAPNVVTDATILSAYAAVTLYITRIGVTHKDSIEGLDAMQQKGTLGKLNIVVNDINFDKERSYQTYYGYKEVYTYGSYEELSKDRTWWQRFKDKLSG